MLQEIRAKGINADYSLTVSTDTRNLPTGCIFFALKGASFDGNEYAAQALQQGASLAVVDNPKVIPSDCASYLLVPDSLRALQELAREWRRELGLPVFGITGSNGKTTTKELLAAVLSRKYKLHYTQGNLNNQIGVPLTLLQLTKGHEFAIVEMGASHPKDIQELVDIAEPNYGLITNVGTGHLLGFGDFETIMQTKAELYDYLKAHGGHIFRNTDNTYLAQMATAHYYDGILPEQAEAGTCYSLQQPADVRGHIDACTPFLQMDMHTADNQSEQINTQLVGYYNAENITAAVCVGLYFGISLHDACDAVARYCPRNNRSMLRQTLHNRIIVDAYNANPTSMRAAINNFIQMDMSRHEQVLLLGDMLELGIESRKLHQEIVDLLNKHGFKQVYLVGDEFGNTQHTYPWFRNAKALQEYLQCHPIENKLILLKGSHSMHMETVLETL
ncbi:MAG: UDP-N-acetylmuramoyl-tripeptide--D-alanyl-D-alanine ligase [Paludibacter sp.]|nr:UDP-N-acetylmuramoyl-tripeptide--D-alanyl-D-alanine ligase [Bacteroidales bacterium]MCM1069761.1 UDP-N-acetylmuramoyl-tripeptide--D-alanyl-D-alanine ligase [Prevotella sp.]MCM1354446.1 UDP-N-acetylmuramoyl-tripeptide--D-alanyl-D-alanine ligase [Bacteroides sp.]MCM1443216.1 UDP-N-acetylmuramoyl-tripeptide--D-alanyl-D-alanine ligase [Muribaculum sp.]MCM1482480.1 UDP-N-acetylmuramoyl-tripeptide--D-alanyl-D-alanine ligase [Paludibacter sp.]